MRILSYFFLCFSVVCSAPKWKADLSSSTVGPHPLIEPSKLDFALNWKEMLKAGTLDIEFSPRGEKKPSSFVIKSSASSRSAEAALFPYSHNYWSEVHPRGLASKYFQSTTENNSKETVVTINRYSPSQVLIEERRTDVGSGKTTTERNIFPHRPARDMFSAILHLRGQEFEIGESTHKPGPYKKPVTLWLSDHADRVPLELRANVYIGDVRAILTKHTKKP